MATIPRKLEPIKPLPTVAPVTNAKEQLEDYFEPEPWEDDDAFETRVRFTRLIGLLPPPYSTLHPSQQSLLGHLLMKAAKFKVSYDPKLEETLRYLAANIRNLLTLGSYEDLIEGRVAVEYE